MDMTFTDEQRELSDLVTEVLSAHLPSDALRRQWEGEGEASFEIYATLAEMGLASVAVPESDGGLGLSMVELAQPLEACGYFAVAEPVALTIGVIAPMIAKFGSDSLKESILSPIMAGDVLGTVAGDCQRVIPGLARADVLLVERDGEVHLVSRGVLDITSVVTMDRTLQAATCDPQLTPATLMAEGDAAVTYMRALSHSVIASVQVGIAQRLIDMTRGYVAEREQFGRPLATFQAVKHRLANAAIYLEAARSLCWYAHYATANEEPGYETATRMAKLAANETGDLANYTALKLHGGIGFTWEYDAHFWLQRGKALSTLYGGSDDLSLELGDSCLKEMNEEVVA